MGNNHSIANHDDVKKADILIHTMDNKQHLLIHGTLTADCEEEAINFAIDKNEFNKLIVVYGKNTQSLDSLVKKQKQLAALGFKNVKMYIGGLFEWALLQDIYGSKEFPIQGAKGPIDPMLFDYL